MSDQNGSIEIHQVDAHLFAGSLRDGPPAWVSLSPVSTSASALYGLLLMHGRNGIAAEPEALALMMRADSADDIEPWLHELVQLGALEVTTRGYRINLAPPDGYTGPRDLDEWNARYDAGTAGGGDR